MRFVETWTTASVVATRDLTPDIREFLLRPDNFAGAPYPAGSHINVGVTSGGLPATRTLMWLPAGDRESTRLNSSHSQISYAVFFLQKKSITGAEIPRIRP